MLYFSYKHYTPEIGGAGDGVYYIKMLLNPFDFNSVGSPYIYRKFTPFITFLLLKIDVLNNAAISYSIIESEKMVFFQFLVSNYIGLFSTALVVSRAIDLEIGKITVSVPLLGGLMCFLSFGASAYVLTTLIEGWSWFFIALGFYAIRRRNIAIFIIAVIFGFFQKEMISVFLGIICFFFLIFKINYNEKIIDQKLFLMLVICILSFSLYVALRVFIMPVSGYENQLNVFYIIENIISFDYFNKSFIWSNFLNQNIYFIFLLLFTLAFCGNKNKRVLKLDVFYTISFSYFTLFLICVGAGLKGDIAHILFMSTPIFSIYAAYYIYILEQRNEGLLASQEASA
jgi:hypothetical protein